MKLEIPLTLSVDMTGSNKTILRCGGQELFSEYPHTMSKDQKALVALILDSHAKQIAAKSAEIRR